MIAVLWRAGLRISEALALNETDIDTTRGPLLIRHGKGDSRREAGMDQLGFEQLAAWMTHRVSLAAGAGHSSVASCANYCARRGRVGRGDA